MRKHAPAWFVLAALIASTFPSAMRAATTNGTEMEVRFETVEKSRRRLQGTHFKSCNWASCTCGGVDLSHLKGTVWKTNGVCVENAADNSCTYSIALCDVLTNIPSNHLPPSCTDFLDHPTVVIQSAKDPGNCMQVGCVGSVTGECDDMMTYEMTGDQMIIKYEYDYGCDNVFEAHLSCGETQMSPGLVHRVLNTCLYSMNWRSSDFCWDSPPGMMSSSWGWSVIKWLAILVLVYLGCGVAYAASQGVREPAKMLPNREFWAGLPAMVSAGVTFFLAAVQGKSTRPVVASGGIGAAPGGYAGVSPGAGAPTGNAQDKIMDAETDEI